MKNAMRKNDWTYRLFVDLSALGGGVALLWIARGWMFAVGMGLLAYFIKQWPED